MTIILKKKEETNQPAVMFLTAKMEVASRNFE